MRDNNTLVFENDIKTSFNDTENNTQYSSNSSIIRSINLFFTTRDFNPNDITQTDNEDNIGFIARKEIKNPGICKNVFDDLVSHLRSKQNFYKWKTINVSYSYNERDDNKDIMTICISMSKYSVNSPKA